MMKVVVVDDEESLLKLTEEFLTIKGYQVKSFSDASAAQQWIEQYQQQVLAIVTDEIMPGAVQGHHLVEQFSQKHPMVLMTGYIDSEELNKLTIPVIYKPFRMMAFADVFEQAVAKFNASIASS
ncbi:MAG: response regulator [Aestuariibacter sp.]